MKSKVFIGSSVEGLKIAYAIQQNLRYCAETTVWDQGVFELSQTTIESLIEILDNSDFGIFVFSPDDLIKIRGEESQAVRDNVIFELGLFIGRLGRERTFIIVPEGANFRLPTDLLGITPGKYETDRSDNSDQAATGSASHKIRLNIEKYGSRHIDESNPSANSGEQLKSKEDRDYKWIDFYIDKKYEEGIKELEKLIKKEKNKDELLGMNLWVAYGNWMINSAIGNEMYRKCIDSNKSKSKPYLSYIGILMKNDLYDEAIKLIEEGLENVPESKDTFISKQAECLVKLGNEEKAKKTLIECISKEKSPELYLVFIDILQNEKKLAESHRLIYEAYTNYPTNQQILFKYSNITNELKLHKISLFLLDKLILIDNKNPDYWTYYGNTCLKLDLNSHAMWAYEKGNELAKSNQAWILGNIGNLYKNVGLYNKAIDFLEKAIKKDNKSEYAHDRLSTSIKKEQEEKKKYAGLLKEGRIAICNLNFDSDD